VKRLGTRRYLFGAVALGVALATALSLQVDVSAAVSESTASGTRVIGLTINGVAGQAFSGPVARVKLRPESVPVSDLTATIKWGDGTTSAGVVSQPTPGKKYVVSGSHTYPESGFYTTSIKVRRKGFHGATGHGSASIAGAVSVTAASVSGVEGQSLTGTVATFTQGDSTAPVSQFTATISWGDGTTSSGTISQDASGDPYAVAGTHTYAEEGTYTTEIAVSASPTNSGSAFGSAMISDAEITASGVTVPPQTTNVAFTSPVATFVDTNPEGSLSDFSASITWGDGTTSSGAITQPGGTGTTFTVTGTQTYSAHGTYTVSVMVTDVGGATSTATDSVTVADAVTNCAGTGCSGSVTGSTQTSAVTSTSTTGTILTDVDPNQNDFSCGDGFRHAPEVTSVTDTDLDANIVYTITFANSAAAGPWWLPFAVCYQSSTPFIDLYGQTVTTGLLPLCSVPFSKQTVEAPCVESINPFPLSAGNVVETIVVPAGDPRFH
jgi:large repetitive protein